jgi:hypothetical protein
MAPPTHIEEVRTLLAEAGVRQMHVEQLPPDAPVLNPGKALAAPEDGSRPGDIKL